MYTLCARSRRRLKSYRTSLVPARRRPGGTPTPQSPEHVVDSTPRSSQVAENRRRGGSSRHDVRERQSRRSVARRGQRRTTAPVSGLSPTTTVAPPAPAQTHPTHPATTPSVHHVSPRSSGGCGVVPPRDVRRRAVPDVSPQRRAGGPTRGSCCARSPSTRSLHCYAGHGHGH